jgi:virulence-associated protein VapD
MHTTLSSARASVRSNLSIALLTCFLIAQVAMGDMHDPRDERIATLRTWFHVNSPDGPVDEEGIQEFLDALKEVHFIDAVAADGRAAAIINNGYTSKHGVAGLTTAELVDLGFLQGNAKQMSMYLGSRPRDPSPARPLPVGPLSIAASQQHSAHVGAAVAMAVATSQTKIKLFDGSTSNPTVSSVLKWARRHMEKVNIAGFGTLTATLQKLIDDMTMDLTPFITAEPALSDDRAYVREVFASLTPDQIKKYADGEVNSALTMMQNVMKSIADTKMSIYITHATTFSNVSTTIDSHAVLGRFKNFTATLSEVRFHKLFDLKDAIKKIVAVIAPNVFLVNEVIASN